MRRWLLALFVIILVGSSIAAFRAHSNSVDKRELEAKQRRDSDYESEVRSYSQKFELGTTRGKVEEEFRTQGVSFEQMVTVNERGEFADLIKLGEEEHPWYCSENYVYVAFEFVSTEPHQSLKVSDSDVLREIRRDDRLSGCL